MMIRNKQNKAFSTINVDQHGFTLLEMLLGVVITALVGFSLFQIFANGMNTYQRAQLTAKVYLQMYKVFDALDADIAAIITFDYRAVDPQWKSFHGNATSMHFVRKAKDGLQMVSYAVYDDKSRGDEVRRKINPLVDVLAKQTKDVAGDVVAKYIQDDGFTLTYAQAEPESVNGKVKIRWQNSWEEEHLPIAIAVKIRFKPNQEKQAPVEFSRIFYLENR